MIADHESKERFDAISDMAAQITDLEHKLTAVTAERDAERKRADQAEARERMLYKQLVNPEREVHTVHTTIEYPADWVKHDAELSRLTSAGWTFMSDGFMYVPGEKPLHYTKLIRVAPIPAESDQSVATAVTVVAAVTKPAVPATPDPAPESNPDALPVKPKTVAPSVIVIPGEIQAPHVDAFDAELARDLQAKAREIALTSPLLNLPHRSFRSPTGVHVQS